MLKGFSLRRKHDASSVTSAASSVFDSAPYSPESAYTDYADSTNGETNPKLRDYASTVENLPPKTPRKTPRTYSLIHNTPPPQREAQKPRARSQLFTSPSKSEVPSNSRRVASTETRTSSILRRSSTHFDAASNNLQGKLRYSQNVRNLTTPASLRIPQETRNSARFSTYTQASKSPDYLKIKLTYTPADEMLALKFSKSKLRSVEELVNVVNIKLHDRYKLKHQKMAVFLAFLDKSLEKVLLGDGSSPSSCIDPLTLDYIQSKSRIYLEATPI